MFWANLLGMLVKLSTIIQNLENLLENEESCLIFMHLSMKARIFSFKEEIKLIYKMHKTNLK